MLERGADLEEFNILHQTPLKYAVMHGSVEVANFLLDKGAKKERRFDFCGNTVRE